MPIDLIIVLCYFAAVLAIALSGKTGKDMTSEEYFLSSRNLRWYSIAISTIATNINGYQFLGMMGSAYLYGLAQANLEINAIQGVFFAAFIFIPLYLKDRVITVSQFIKNRLGKNVALVYSVANMLLFSTVGLGAALFWGAYAADFVFSDYLLFIHEDAPIRIAVLVIALGIFSAIYTYSGGLTAVVRTDIIQFGILLIGGTVVLFISIYHLGSWDALYQKTPELMHLHLDADHEKLPWIAIGGMFLLNINYWCANQSVVQRSLAARSLKDAQLGLMVGGIMKYYMAIIIIIPGIALFGILGDAGTPLEDPDQAFPFIVKTYLPVGVQGIILCAIFASLMSTVDSLFNSLATLWTIDIYKEYINKEATDKQMVATGRKTILVTLCTGILMGFVLLYIKFNDPGSAFTHTLNELRYFINCGIVIIICAAAFLLAPNHRLALAMFIVSPILHLVLQYFFPEMNYIVRAMWVILIGFFTIAVPTIAKNGMRKPSEFIKFADPQMRRMGLALLASLALCHWVFH